MKAAVCTAYGPPEVLQVRDVPNPVPKAREVLIKIHATSVSASDTYIRDGLSFAPLPLQLLMRLVIGITRPRKPILGLVLAGEIERAGKGVERFRAGDRVYAMTNLRFGAYAQFACLKETGTLARSPSNLTDDQAAALPYGGLLALHFLKKSGLHSGQSVLVYGASGAIGTAAIQIAKIFGALVTAACGPTNLDLVKALGAEAAIDYTRTSSPGRHFDLVLDAVGGTKTSAFKVACRAALTPGGRYVSVDDGIPRLKGDHLAQLTMWAEAGKLEPVIDRRYPLDQIVDAHRYVDQGHKKGNVIITVPHAVP
jgi:NADPH:quinone reductase-like Zn-dependent oxidoreductase